MDEVGDNFIFEHGLTVCELTSKLFLRELLVQEVMAVFTQVDALLHFVSGEMFFEPFVGVAESWDEMMKCQPLLTAAELAVLLFFIFRH